jgi:hypothetical protein
MDDQYFKAQAARVRQIASLADPFTKKRLLALAERYEDAKSSPRKAPLPSVAVSGIKPTEQTGADDAG